MFFRGVTNPTVMPTGPDAKNLLDPSSMSVLLSLLLEQSGRRPTKRAQVVVKELASDSK